MTAAGYRDNGGPGERPHSHPGYYAAFVQDADGTNVESVHHGFDNYFARSTDAPRRPRPGRNNGLDNCSARNSEEDRVR